MNQQSEVLYVPDLARKLGRTEAAIRTAVNRKADWLPPAFSMGRRLAWRVTDVDKFLAAQAGKTNR
jgi:predicted DNA-binding transcriptional regulator AlpA